jgi:hypothetical protein
MMSRQARPYRFDDGTLRTVAAVGNPDPLEFSDARDRRQVAPLVEASGGRHVASDNLDPSCARCGLKAPPAARRSARRNEGYTVAGSTSRRRRRGSWWRWRS